MKKQVIQSLLIVIGIYLIIDSLLFIGYINGWKAKEDYLDAIAKRTFKKGNIFKYPHREAGGEKSEAGSGDSVGTSEKEEG